MDKELSALFPRIGGKATLKEKIYKMFPPDIKIYAEPFVGGGSVFFGYSFNDAPRIILNDKDDKLISIYRIIKNIPDNQLNETDINKYDTTDINKLELLRQNNKSNFGKLLSYIIEGQNTFLAKYKGKLYKNTSPINKLKKMLVYKSKLEKATLLSVDYKNVINKYDTPTTFFYLDPPL